MWAYNDTPSNELYHYGVIGMKWGVKRGRSDKVFTKAQKKMSKLDAKMRKAQKIKYKRSKPLFRTSASDDKYKEAVQKADRATAKALKWYKKVEKVLGSEKASEMKNRKGVEIGKAYFQSMSQLTDYRMFH